MTDRPVRRWVNPDALHDYSEAGFCRIECLPVVPAADFDAAKQRGVEWMDRAVIAENKMCDLANENYALAKRVEELEKENTKLDDENVAIILHRDRALAVVEEQKQEIERLKHEHGK